MRTKLDNNAVDQRLIKDNRSIKRLDNYTMISTKIRWQCLVENCGYIWSAAPNDVLNGDKTGCARCSGNERLSNNIIDQRLNGKNIKRLEDCKGALNKIKWMCLIEDCNYIWSAEPNNIVNNRTGCPKCAGNLPINNEEIDRRLVNRKIR